MAAIPITLFAFGFVQWAMLGWLAAASLPILIHLLNRRRQRETTWAAMEFLLAAIQKNSRRMRLEQWLLLAIRTLLIALLVLAVAEPFLEQLGVAVTSGQRTHKVIVIDSTFSMDYRPTDRSRFDRAKQLAQQIVEESPQGDAFTLVQFANPPQVIVGTPALSSDDIQAEIENLSLLHTSGDLPATVAQLEQLLTRAGRENPRLQQTEIYFLTDLGRSSWVPEFSGADAAEQFRLQTAKLSQQAAMRVIDLGAAGSENVAVTGLRMLDAVATVGSPVTIEVDLHNFGRQDVTTQAIELQVDDHQAARQSTAIAAGESATVAFSYAFDTPGSHAVSVNASGDLLAVDNHRWLSVPVKQRINVLCVNGRPSGQQYGGATDYLAVALAPHTSSTAEPVVVPRVITETQLLETDLTRYDCIFLADVGQFTGAEARALASYLKGGGGLVFFMGNQVRLDSYNQALLGLRPEEPRIMPGELIEVVDENQYSLDPLGYRHPIVSPFRGQQQAGLLTTPVSRYVRLQLPEDATAEVALAFDNGDPLIVQSSAYGGRVIVVTTSADTSWTTMPVWPSFVPIVQELLSAALGNQSGRQNLTVGQDLTAAIRTPDTQQPAIITLPNQETAEVRLEPDGDHSLLSYQTPLESGLYRVRIPDGAEQVPTAEPAAPSTGSEQQQLYAVNLDTAESDLSKLTPEQLRDDVWAGVNFEHLTGWQDVDDEPSGQITRRSNLHRWLLYGVLGLLLADTSLAWYLGNRRA